MRKWQRYWARNLIAVILGVVVALWSLVHHSYGTRHCLPAGMWVSSPGYR